MCDKILGWFGTATRVLLYKKNIYPVGFGFSLFTYPRFYFVMHPPVDGTRAIERYRATSPDPTIKPTSLQGFLRFMSAPTSSPSVVVGSNHILVRPGFKYVDSRWTLSIYPQIPNEFRRLDIFVFESDITQIVTQVVAAQLDRRKLVVGNIFGQTASSSKTRFHYNSIFGY